MKTICVIALLALMLPAGAELITDQPARLVWKIEWHPKGNSGISGAEVNPSPDATYPGAIIEDTCTTRGFEHDLKCTFLGRDQNRDVYRFTFTRMTKNRDGAPSQTTSTKEIPFDGKEVVVFDDSFQSVIMKSPDKNDLAPQPSK